MSTDDHMLNDPAYQKYYNKAVNRGDADPHASAKLDWDDDHADDPDFSQDPAVLCPAIAVALGGLGGAKVERVIYTRTSPPEYRVETDRGTVKLGPPNRWTIRWAEVKAAFAHVAHGLPPELNRDDRNRVIDMILRAAEEQDLGDYATEEGEARMWLDYLTDICNIVTHDDPSYNQASHESLDVYIGGYADLFLYVHKDGRVLVPINKAHRRIKRKFDPPDLTNRAFAARMEKVGCKAYKEQYTKTDGRLSTRDMLVLPPGTRITGGIVAGAGKKPARSPQEPAGSDASTGGDQQ